MGTGKSHAGDQLEGSRFWIGRDNPIATIGLPGVPPILIRRRGEWADRAVTESAEVFSVMGGMAFVPPEKKHWLAIQST